MTQHTDPLFTIRETKETDLPYIQNLLVPEGMTAPDAPEGYVAVDGDDEPVGFIRIQETEKGPHVAPVAVFPEWQGLGVGRALMDHELRRCGYLKLVARGSAVPFYRALGYREISFDEVSNELEEDCTVCEYLQECSPVPFMLEYRETSEEVQ